jgi:hypothetical protein
MQTLKQKATNESEMDEFVRMVCEFVTSGATSKGDVKAWFESRF